MTENDNYSSDGVEFDQRTEERIIFANGYKNLNQFESKMYGEGDREYYRQFVAQCRTLVQILLRYVKDEELREKGIDLREHSAKELDNMKNEESYIPAIKILDAYRDIVEDLRHNANFKIPEKTSYDNENVGVEQL